MHPDKIEHHYGDRMDSVYSYESGARGEEWIIMPNGWESAKEDAKNIINDIPEEFRNSEQYQQMVKDYAESGADEAEAFEHAIEMIAEFIQYEEDGEIFGIRFEFTDGDYIQKCIEDNERNEREHWNVR